MLTSEKALIEAIYEYMLFSDIVRVTDKKDINTKLISTIDSRKQYFKSCEKEKKEDLFISHIVQFENRGDFLPDDGVNAAYEGIALNSAKISADLYVGEIDVVGTSENEANVMLQAAIRRAGEMCDEAGGAEGYLEAMKEVAAYIDDLKK